MQVQDGHLRDLLDEIKDFKLKIGLDPKDGDGKLLQMIVHTFDQATGQKRQVDWRNVYDAADFVQRYFDG